MRRVLFASMMVVAFAAFGCGKQGLRERCDKANTPSGGDGLGGDCEDNLKCGPSGLCCEPSDLNCLNVGSDAGTTDGGETGGDTGTGDTGAGETGDTGAGETGGDTGTGDTGAGETGTDAGASDAPADG
jgi:hypothetical protein